MKLIKQAITYKAEIPQDKALLLSHLEEQVFTECMAMQVRSTGFVPVFDGGELVETFPGGLAFRVRIDDKIIPSSAIKRELEKRIKEIQDQTGRKVGRKEKLEIKDGVMVDLASRALTKTTASVCCFYEFKTGFLIINTTSKHIADVCVTLLIKCVGSIKTETLHVSDVKHGLTTRLKTWLLEDDGFDEFEPCDEVALINDRRKISVKMTSLQQAHAAIIEALLAGFSVSSMGFHYGNIDFRMTSDFRLKGIAINDPEAEIVYENSDGEAQEETWQSEAAIQVKAVSGVIVELMTLLQYQSEETQEEIK
jgi:recombination associated protein RdgC